MPRHAREGYWIEREAGSDYWYRHWYDPERKRVRRESLATEDYVAAQRIAAERAEAQRTPAQDGARHRNVKLARGFSVQGPGWAGGALVNLPAMIFHQGDDNE